MKQKTPLTILEQWVNERLEYYDDDTDEYSCYWSMRAKIQELKPLERQGIENAFMEGAMIMEGPYEGKKHYFTTNYEQ